MFRYTPAVNSVAYSYPKITPGYLPPAKVAYSAPAAVTVNSAAYTAPIVTKYTSAPATTTTTGYNGYNGYSGYSGYSGYGSVYDAALTKGAYYSAPAKVLSPAITKYVSAPAVSTTYAATPTVAPVACKYIW